MMRRDVFQAIADPTRRTILGMLAIKSLSLKAVAENFEVSRPAISKQVKILQECGLIEIHQIGRERFCHVKLESFSEVSLWLNQYKPFWESKLNHLEEYLFQNQSEKKNDKSNS